MNQNIIAQQPAVTQRGASLDELLQRRTSASSLSVAFTVIEAGAGCAPPSKSFGIGEGGQPIVLHSGGQPSSGLASRKNCTGTAGEILTELGSILDGMSPRQALVCAPPPGDAASWPFVSQKDVGERTDVIARTKQRFPAPAGVALFGLDFDIKAWPLELQKRTQAGFSELMSVLCDIAPCFASAAYVDRASSSVGIRNPRTGVQTDGNSGRHFFLIAKRGEDVARAVRALHRRLVLAGWGYGFVSEAGTVLIRSLVDVDAASDLSRLWFEGRVQLSDGLELIAGARDAVVLNREGGAVDTTQIADLDAVELAQLASVEDRIRASCGAEAELKRSAWQDRRQAEMVARGIDPDRAAKTVRAAVERHTLAPDFTIELDDGGVITVADIYADLVAHHGKTCADPLEPEYGGGRNKAVIYTDGATPTIYSHAHGGIHYSLESLEDTEWFDASATGGMGTLVAPTGSSSSEPAAIDWITPAAWQGSTPAPQEWEVENWIPRHEVTLLYGDGGVGKTLLAHQYATAAATGRKWLGQPTRAARVMCFFCEDDENELHRRQSAINQSLGLAMDDLKNLRLVSRKHDLNILAQWDQKAGGLKLTSLWHQLRDGAQDFGADVIIIDTLADVYAGSEIDRAQVSAFVKLCLGGLAQAIGGSVIALGHPSQSGKNTGSGTSGSTAWSNAARSRIYLKRPEGPQQRGRYAGATPESSGNVRELENMKLNYGPKGSKLKLEWKRGAFVPLGGSSPISNSEALETDVPDLDDMAERAVAEAIIARSGVRLAQFTNSPYYAPKVLKTQAAGILKSLTLDETAAAFERLVSKSIIRAVEVARTPDRKPIMGYEIDPTGGAAIDNVLLEDEPCPSAFT